MDYASYLGGGSGGGGGGYGGDIKSDIKSGGTNTGTFGAINFGAGASVGGATTATGSGSAGNSTLLYLGLAALALVAFIFLRR